MLHSRKASRGQTERVDVTYSQEVPQAWAKMAGALSRLLICVLHACASDRFQTDVIGSVLNRMMQVDSQGTSALLAMCWWWACAAAYTLCCKAANSCDALVSRS